MKKDMDITEVKNLNDLSLGSRMAGVLLISIFIGEGLVMLLVRSLHLKYFSLELLVDSLILSFLTFPSIYYFVIRPFNIQSARRKQAEQAIRESERLYKTLFERSNDAIFKVDLSTGKYLDANHAAEILTGRSVEELRKLKTSDLAPLDADKRLEKIIDTRETFALGEVEYHRSDGTSRTALLTSIPLGENQIFGFAHDITERKRLDSEIKNSLALIEAAFESIHNGLLVVNHQGTIIKSNAKFAEMWQIPPDILSTGDDKTLLNCVLEQLADPDEFIAKVNKLYEEQNAESVDLIELKDGRIFKRISKPMYLGGEAKGRVWSFLDITERIKAQQSLLKSEANLQTLLNTIPDLIWLKDLNGMYLSCNTMFERLIGLTEAEITGKDDFHFFDPELAEFFRNNDRISFDAGKLTNNEEWLTFADNGYRGLFDVIKTPMYDAKGTFIGILGIGHDITERKRDEAEIKLKTEQLLKLNTEKDKFFSIIAHDLRSPFVSFLGLTQLLAEDLPNLTMTEIQEITGSISKSASNLYRLLENLLQWSQIQQGTIPFNQETISLNEVVNECIEMLQPAAKFKDIEVATDIPFDLNAFADSNMLQTVIRNLLSNAVKFSHKGGKVGLSAKENRYKKIEIIMKDTGIGMSPEIVDNLFRIDVKTNRPGTDGEPSTGLGLLLCKEFIEKNGGEIFVESEEGKGSVFNFTLPCNN